MGNRISMDEDGTETTYTYNSLNQLVSSTERNVNASYIYDGRGNQISEIKGGITTESTYSVRGEMLTLTKKRDNTVFVSQENTYNHEGIRIAKKEDGITRRYYYDNGIVAYTKDGTALSSANLTGPDGQVIGTFRGEDYHIYLKDIQGSTASIVKDDGSLSAAYEYSNFGETEEITESSFDNEICYTGAVYDDTTGLYYMNARYYNPENGRFISQDTYRGALSNPLQWHLYAYCANNPINYVDPSGHWIVSIGFKAEAAYVFGGYVMIMGNYDGKHLLVTYSLGAKFVTNATASAGISFATYTYKSVDKLLGWGATLGFNLAGTVSGGISFDKNGNVGGSFGASYAWLKTPKLAPFYFDFEFGYTKKIIKYKWNAIPKTKKYFKKYGLKLHVQRKDNYVKLGSSKSKLCGKIYKNGRVIIGR